jgi:membrane protein YqaA with SNARE-associated domain
MNLRGTDFVTEKSGEAGRCSRLADVCRQQVRQSVGGFGKLETEWSRRYGNMERGNRGNRARVRLLPARRQLRVVILDHPGFGKIDMADIDGIRMQHNRLMGMDFGTVLIPVAAMLMLPRQVRMRRCPLHRHEDGQQNEIGRGAKALFDQGNGAWWKTVGIVSCPGIALSGRILLAAFTTYLGLFLVALGAATLLPLQSELVLAGLLASGEYSVVTLLIVASTGNILGSCVNWWLGRYIEHFRERRWFPVKPNALEKASAWYHRYGRWSLLMSWAPVIGDPLTLVAGVLREPWWSFLILVSIAKVARYLMIAGVTLGWPW